MQNPYKKYLIRPLQHALDLSLPALNQPFPFASWPTQNIKIDQRSVMNRAGYVEDRDLGDGVEVQQIIYFENSSGTVSTVYLTDTQACKRDRTNTWSYITQKYSTGTISSIADNVVTGSSTGWATGSNNPAAGDFFVVDADLSATSEPDANWVEIASVDNDTQITLVSAYPGATSSGNYTVRQSYTVPENERWTWAIVNDKLCFTNGNTNVQSYTGSGNATDLDTTDATKARYCIEFADRLLLADLYVSAVREPYTVKWSKNGDPTDWTDDTAGSVELLESQDFITGLGKSGANLVVYKADSITFGQRSGVSTDPIKFPRTFRGAGAVAPYSIVQVESTDVFIGRNDFYIVDGDRAVPIRGSDKIRYKFFDLVGQTEIKKVFGYNNLLQNEVRWMMTDINNVRRVFVWNYKYFEWYHYIYDATLSCGGKGEI